MFWQCCKRSNEEFTPGNGRENSNQQNKKESRLPYNMEIRLSTISNGSLNSNISNSNSIHSNGSGSAPVSIHKGRIRTQSSSSIKSAESFYSVKSTATSAGGEGDFYSICSVDSFKST